MPDNKDEAKLERARILSEALPFMQRYDKRTVVVKYGGHAMGDETLGAEFARDIVMLKQAGLNPIVVHGGGPQIGAMLTRLGIKSEFSGGLRITDRATVEIVEMVLAGSINKQIVAQLNQAGGRAVGLCGKDGNLIVARKVEHKVHDPESNIEKLLDLGFVGEPDRINPEILQVIQKSDIIPVIAPIGVSASGETYNINADTVAGAIAAAMGATRLLLLTDVSGVLDKQGKLMEVLTVGQAKALMKDGTISGGMIPKLETCIESVEGGVEAVVILDGRVRHAVLLELFTEHGAGTLIQN
ncbi:acetylglutamate kinase [Parvibaculum sp.]|jgi:acetylglutamate kinase|uniref:acetylglutamate kinase n=2 Tax=Parvibaculum sp. TaxID=2024848 RepID=UPI001B0E0262|nr:acetylglutamate kinase [Parvibaculum sp.]MBO6677944.1 acetylglutamate kinase [Parvibaculum sp.]MBO6683419.1 acetylglutamate kinase [Parvibaculum sp.]MBO6906395.1 acetylglutamate kinase [Parvibaculum sp.]